MTKQSLPAVSTLAPETLEEFKTADKVVVVAYFSADDTTSNTTFSEVAEQLRDDYLFGATNDAALATAEGVKQPAIVLYKSFDEGKNTFEEKLDAEAISKFIKTSAIPLVGEVGPDTYAGYMAVSSCEEIYRPLTNGDWLGWHSACIYLRRNPGRARHASRDPEAPRPEA